MKCDECSRGITYRRVARDGAVKIGGLTFCGGCVVRGVVDDAIQVGVDRHGFTPYVILPRAWVDYRLHPDAGGLRMHQLELAR